MRRQARLFAIAELLRGRRTGVTAETLSERFGVSVRTIYRDLDSLRDASLPVLADRGRGGGFALDRSYSLPPVNFTAREAAVLEASAQWLVESRLLPFVETLQGAIDKVRGALSPQARRELSHVLSSLAFVGVPARPCPPKIRATLEEAWLQRAPLRMRYDGARGVTDRLVRVESVVMDRSETLLNCTDLATGESRQFKLHCVLSAELAGDLTPPLTPPRRP
jgi:predicted DNA-binding transcriptional regulator YafY